MASVVTNEVRLSYVHIMEPFAAMPGQEPKYSVTILVPKSDAATKAAIDQAIEQAKAQGANKSWGGVIPPVCPVPVYDGDGVRPDGSEFGPEAKGHYVFTARSKAKPEVVDSVGNPILVSNDVYSGMYGRVYVEFYPYSFGGKKGIGCSLGPVQKLRDGEPLGAGPVSAAKAFGFTAPPQIDPITGQPVQAW